MAETNLHAPADPSPAAHGSTGEQLRRLAEVHRIGTTYRGWNGTESDVGDATLRKVLTALGVPCASDDDVRQSLEEAEVAPWRRLLPPVVVASEGISRQVFVHAPAGTVPRLWVVLEDGARREITAAAGSIPPDPEAEDGEVREIDGTAVRRTMVELPADLPLGWHTLHAEVDGAGEHCALAVTPARLATTERILARRGWGLMAQLYSVRSARSWGIGDLADLADLSAVAADHGADFTLINPLHAAEPVPPVEPSPYLPTTRRFFNPLYIRVEDVPEYAYLPGAARTGIEESARRLQGANAEAGLLDRNSSYAAKLDALEPVFAVRRGAAREQQFRAFCAEAGQGLEDFALWCALSVELPADAPEWADAGGPRSAYAREQRDRLADRIDFYKWLQWICDEQLESAQRAATKAGMGIGVVHDLAVGVSAGGADAWTLRDVLASSVRVGAPPDMFNQQGQDWGQPPWHPGRLAEAGYAPYRAMLKTILRHAGGIRVDHILGLFRLWWIPEDDGPSSGAYVYYDHEALVGILALEAQRANAVVIGEDLGTFEPAVQDYLAERGILGTSILWFEHTGDGPRQPEDYRRACLTSVTTHDLPPTAGYLAGEHVDLRNSLGLLSRPVEEERAADAAAQQAVLDRVREHGLLPQDRDQDQDQDRGAAEADAPDGDASGQVQRTVEALHAFIALTPSALLGVSLADAVGERRTQNQPGTHDEYPNWRIPLAGPDGRAVSIDELADNPRFVSLASICQAALAGSPDPTVIDG